jgi:hypothetical protein
MHTSQDRWGLVETNKHDNNKIQIFKFSTGGISGCEINHTMDRSKQTYTNMGWGNYINQ